MKSAISDETSRLHVTLLGHLAIHLKKALIFDGSTDVNVKKKLGKPKEDIRGTYL